MPKVRDGFVGLDEVKYDTSIYPRDKQHMNDERGRIARAYLSKHNTTT